MQKSADSRFEAVSRTNTNRSLAVQAAHGNKGMTNGGTRCVREKGAVRTLLPGALLKNAKTDFIPETTMRDAGDSLMKK